MYLLKPIGNYKTIITSILVYTYEKQSDIISEDFFFIFSLCCGNLPTNVKKIKQTIINYNSLFYVSFSYLNMCLFIIYYSQYYC